MTLSLRSARHGDFPFCESLNRHAMGGYLAARVIPWDGSRFLASWAQFENLMILADSRVVGVLRLLPEQDALGLRDLQVVPERQGQGIGSWAVQQAKSIAGSRGFERLRLRVYEENPARALYARLGFTTESVTGGTVHMACELPPENSLTGNPPRGSA
jgi:GNAT superfamily N-acetyltransferase